MRHRRYRRLPISETAYLRQRRYSAGTRFRGRPPGALSRKSRESGEVSDAESQPPRTVCYRVPARETDSRCGGRTPHTSLYHTAIGSERYSERSSKRVAGESGAPSSGALLELSNGSQGT